MWSFLSGLLFDNMIFQYKDFSINILKLVLKTRYGL